MTKEWQNTVIAVMGITIIILMVAIAVLAIEGPSWQHRTREMPDLDELKYPAIVAYYLICAFGLGNALYHWLEIRDPKWIIVGSLLWPVGLFLMGFIVTLFWIGHD